jgi:hypothetical protein
VRRYKDGRADDRRHVLVNSQEAQKREISHDQTRLTWINHDPFGIRSAETTAATVRMSKIRRLLYTGVWNMFKLTYYRVCRQQKNGSKIPSSYPRLQTTLRCYLEEQRTFAKI